MTKILSATREPNFFKVYFPPGSTMSFFLSLHSSSFGFFIPFRTPSDPSFSFGSFEARGLTRADDRGERATYRTVSGFRYSVVCRARGETKKPHAAAQGFRIFSLFFILLNAQSVCHFHAHRVCKGTTKTLYSHSMQTNAFSLIFVSPVRSRDSDSTDYLYSPCSTASVYHFFISVIKRLFCCGLRGLFPWNYYSNSSVSYQAE